MKFDIPPGAITYQLVIELRRPVCVAVGRLGEVPFPAGTYVYTGSARRGVEARVRRHVSPQKRLHWHIDYLLANPQARVVEIRTRERVRTLIEAAEALDYFFREPPVFDEKAKTQHLVAEHAQLLEDVADQLSPIEAWDAKSIEAIVVAWLEPSGRQTKDIAHPVRVALTGRGSSPGLFDVIAGLGKERAMARLRTAAAFARTNPGATTPATGAT